ncbi:MAG: hypothetical protein GXO48_06230 [Chlorobi bacterium]|nr:hypothetical protein [Chlorobiota bacterium]
MLKRIAILGIAIGTLSLVGCQCEHGEAEEQASVNVAAVDSLKQVISSLEQELNTAREEVQQCQTQLETLKTEEAREPETTPQQPKSKPKSTTKTTKTNTEPKPKQPVSLESDKNVSSDKKKSIKNLKNLGN